MKKIYKEEIDALEARLAALPPTEVAADVRKLVKMKRRFLHQK